MQIGTLNFQSKTTTISSTTIETDKFIDDLQHLHETVELLSNGIHILDDELKHLTSESLQQSQSIETIDKILPMAKTSIEESNNMINAMNTNLAILQQELSSLKQKYEDLYATSYDGTLIWKISQFQEKMSKNI